MKEPKALNLAACFLDYDGDGRIDLFLPAGGSRGGFALFHNVGGKFVNASRTLDSRILWAALPARPGDYDNDGATDIAVASAEAAGISVKIFLLRNEGNGKFKDVTDAAKTMEIVYAPLKPEVIPTSLDFIDYDHDGDLDLYVTSQDDLKLAQQPLSERIQIGPNVMWRNNGDGTFTDVSGETGLTGSAASPEYSASVGFNYNNDRAVDLVDRRARRLSSSRIHARASFPHANRGLCHGRLRRGRSARFQP